MALSSKLVNRTVLCGTSCLVWGLCFSHTKQSGRQSLKAELFVEESHTSFIEREQRYPCDKTFLYRMLYLENTGILPCINTKEIVMKT